MLKEALEFMAGVGRASAPTIMTATAEPGHIYFVRQLDGSLKKTEAEPPPTASLAYSLQAIIAHATAEPLDVWYNAETVIARFGDELRSRITLNLYLGEQMKVLQAWKTNSTSLMQVELIRALRTTFRSATPSNPELAAILRRVNFKSTASTQGEVGHGTASLGKQIAGEVTGVWAIPEYVVFTFPVYGNPCFRGVWASVECALEPDAGNGTFRVIPLPGQLECAVESAVAEIAEQLRKGIGDDVALYFGKP